ncbi:hypothetical protein ACFLT4_04220 [Chloroflexota bacterium]
MGEREGSYFALLKGRKILIPGKGSTGSSITSITVWKTLIGGG